MATYSEKFVLVYYVPVEDTKAVTAAIHATGAGTWPGNTYGETCFITDGTGQFRGLDRHVSSRCLMLTRTGPLQGANPKIGNVGDLEHVNEHRVEMVIFGRSIATEAVAALKKAHPYEVVAYTVTKVEDV